MASGANRVYNGSYMGTGAAQTISVCGFKPRYIKIVNVSTGDSVEQFEAIANLGVSSKAGGYKTWVDTVTVTVGEGADELTETEVDIPKFTFLTAAQGVTPKAQGFEVGTDAACNGDGVQYAYICTD